MSKPLVLVIEDDRSISEVLVYNLNQAGYDVLVSYDGQDGIRQAKLKNPALVILDLMLPIVDGREVCRTLRAEDPTREILILMLTAKSEETDQVVGFSLGADDYVTKPFSIKVLLERIRALLRRREYDPGDEEQVESQGIAIDLRRHRVTAGEEILSLTRSEFALLETMLRQPGRAYTRSDLIDTALGDDVLVLERTIDVHIRGLRKKLGKYADLIETVRGVGYRFREQN